MNKIIVEAYQQGASDIHIEPRPGKDKTMIRFRKDGSLVNYIEIPASYRSSLITRLKIMCDLDISEKRRPQDGKIKFKPIKLDQLGLAPRNHENLIKCVEKPYGLFFVCGPTGSGKTTTLHSVLGYLNRPETKIWTAEDPVEITQKGLRQVQVNKKAGLDFATVMKAFLRADPDIIMVGEMRDPETTGIGIEASLTIWCLLPCTPIPPRSRSSACSTWAWTPSILPMHCSAFWRNVLVKGCARIARMPTSRRQKR